MSVNIRRRVVATKAFTDWISDLADQIGKAAIVERIERLKNGLFGTAKPLTNASGVWEMVIDVGPGYRVYYTQTGNTIVLLLLGGDKRTQKTDIKRAAKMVADMVAKQRDAKKNRREDGEGTVATDKNPGIKVKLKRK